MLRGAEGIGQRDQQLLTRFLANTYSWCVVPYLVEQM
jgi:hypothetical protein